MSEDDKNSPLDVFIDSDLEDLVPKFMEHRRHDVEVMREALRSGEQDRIRHLAHRMLGTAGSYGFIGLSDLAGELEKDCLGGEGARIHALIDAIDDHLKRVRVLWK